MSDAPLISCLMVTLPVPARMAGLKRSVADYLRQTHGRRELVVVMNGGEPEVRAAIRTYLASLNREDIRIIDPPGELSLGALRNISRASARGDVICQWDDDDFYHPQRLERQAALLADANTEAVFLQQILHFFLADRSLYCVTFRPTVEQGFPGSLMCRADLPIAYPETGPLARRGEDTTLLDQLKARGGARFLADAPHLYIYVNHGQNTWSDAHHRRLAEGLGMSRGLLQRREHLLREALATFDFGPGDVTVQAPNGPAFTINSMGAADGG